MSQLGIVALFLEMDYLRMLKNTPDVELMCGEIKILHLVDRSYYLT